jgi:hypothetical protein
MTCKNFFLPKKSFCAFDKAMHDARRFIQLLGWASITHLLLSISSNKML